MIVVKTFVVIGLIAAFGYTALAVYVVLSDCHNVEKMKGKESCIHTDTDCESCISQSGCTLKDNNIISCRKE